MRLLIDECIDERLRLLFPGYDCQTARFAKLAGLKKQPTLIFSSPSTRAFPINANRRHHADQWDSRIYTFNTDDFEVLPELVIVFTNRPVVIAWNYLV